MGAIGSSSLENEVRTVATHNDPSVDVISRLVGDEKGGDTLGSMQNIGSLKSGYDRRIGMGVSGGSNAPSLAAPNTQQLVGPSVQPSAGSGVSGGNGGTHDNSMFNPGPERDITNYPGPGHLSYQPPPGSLSGMLANPIVPNFVPYNKFIPSRVPPGDPPIFNVAQAMNGGGMGVGGIAGSTVGAPVGGSMGSIGGIGGAMGGSVEGGFGIGMASVGFGTGPTPNSGKGKNRNQVSNKSATQSNSAKLQADLGYQEKFFHEIKRHVSGERDQASMVLRRVFQCYKCGKIFKHRSKMMRHRRIHTGEKPFQCQECNKKFRQRCHLRVHLQIHVRKRQNRENSEYRGISSESSSKKLKTKQ
mmetsp:Transcript_13665/g.21612  ORF Transcript_13665/g.21612 Transcript_13665/m.21612 type:complete len:359 (+) Transcript_13665:943-2019(+)